MKDTFTTNAGKYLCMRQHMYDLIQVLKEIDKGQGETASGASIGVHGPRGSGKTTLVNVLAMYAQKNDWLLLPTTGRSVRNLFSMEVLTGKGCYVVVVYTKAHTGRIFYFSSSRKTSMALLRKAARARVLSTSLGTLDSTSSSL